MTTKEHTFNKKYIKSIFGANTSLGDKEAKETALKAVEQLRLPNRKTSGWEKTDLTELLDRKYTKAEFKLVKDEYIRHFSLYGIDSDLLIFNNGFFDEKSSMIKSAENIYVGSVKRAMMDMPKVVKKYFNTVPSKNENLFNALNSAYAEDGFLIYVPDDTTVERPVHIMNFIDAPNGKPAIQTGNLIVLGKNTSIDVINSYHTIEADNSFTNVLTEVILEENAALNYHIFQGEGSRAGQYNKTIVKQEKSSAFKAHTTTMCGLTVKNEIQVDLTAEDCYAEADGIYMPDHREVMDNSVLFNHNKPNGKSSQMYRGIIDDYSRAIFTGKIYVAQDAQHTDAEQSNRNILVSDDARAYSRPQLEIYADDVACAHGYTVGQIDKESMFYLRSRGISKRNAQRLLLVAFISEVLAKVTVEPYRQYINYLVNQRLRGEDMETLCQVKICPSCRD
ncbi:MAG: Fe-S cluster assembly protein SufD [Bacteroidota bacterium]|nr:Fe-S cluster assembly protein SufD [Bacteroidota bacterium]